MTKNLNSIGDQEPTMGEVGDGLKAWLTSREDDGQEEATEEPQDASQEPSQEPKEDTPQEGAEEPQDGPVDPNPQDDTADSPKAPEEPEDMPQEDTAEADNLAQAYAELQAKVAELEAREAARAEAAQKTEALAAAGIKGNYGQLLTGNSDTWAAQIALLKEFAAENMPAVSIPRDPAVDADLFDAPEEITADEFLKSHHDEW